MGLVELFGVASMPVIKVLIITAVGLLLALDNVNLLGKDARIQVNHLVHYVFNPALVGGNLADTITFENVVLLWFMPVNILLTFIIGSALGWILIKLTRAPKHLEGLILGVCSAGNLGNLPIIIIPAICKDKGSPFGDSNVCYQYGMAYASLSMAVGAVYTWTYVYNIMRVSASVVPKDDYRTSSFRLEASGEFLEFIPEEESSEPENPPKDNMDDYTLLLSSIESEENVKLPISAKIKQQFGNLLVNSNFRAIFSPATLGAIVGFIVGVVPQIRKLMIGGDASLHVIQDSVTMVGEAAVPIITLIMGANLLKGLKGANTSIWTVIGIIVVRYIFLPILGILVIKGATQLGLVQPDPLYQFVLLLQYALPPAMAIGTIAQLFGAGEGECSVIMLWTYVLASVAVTFWTTYFMWLVA
ncbi:protein PIN-LIKES 3-like [Glycine soja]|uniref:Protein PIN-LIKES 3 isoform A n=2 Tax=Glycine soja TaxID=3848 RepID=A0A445HYZ5_GLYSO|nr:protein PIN-LIKES 3-like [Glycine soja]XP_028190981.1 protein PIN-LIKES 3-like [Glycine soja]XP_028190982.1 protein PIN-LIKES 3-like [Glycine soja]RZB79003.1 Protein PIN-LIKES 3 isoform A [Glycine soja]RZB79004.1 Protein PIN-LIKES 3 isoform B [Glycine soja]RZB79005.1 Protein PIN-LIKES 3 isoform C [Glycine soja]RZB79006.1 Protein PIN-LIKES 3 isoform D [Glycine soja]